MDEHHGSAAATPSGQVFKVAEVAALLRVHKSTVYRDVAAGRITAIRVGKGRGTVRIPELALREYQANAVTEVAA